MLAWERNYWTAAPRLNLGDLLPKHTPKVCLPLATGGQGTGQGPMHPTSNFEVHGATSGTSPIRHPRCYRRNYSLTRRASNRTRAKLSQKRGRIQARALSDLSLSANFGVFLSR